VFRVLSEDMCDLFDAYWQPALALAVFATIIFLPLRMKLAEMTASKRLKGEPGADRPENELTVQRLGRAIFWARGLVAVIIFVLFILGVICTGSPGDYPGIVPD